MKAIFKIFLISLISMGLYSCASQDFQFPDSGLGEFARKWFDAANTGELDILQDYPMEEWNDYFQSIVALVDKTGGLEPYMISYETDSKISIYSREGEIKWVKINLGYSKKHGITAMGIRKSYMPVHNNEIGNLNDDQITDILNTMTLEFSENYVRPDVAEQLVDFISGDLTDKYMGLSKGDLFAENLTKDLRKFTGDKHLQVISPTLEREVEVRFRSEGTQQSENHEMPIKAEILNGNIGLITMDRFVDSDLVRSRTKEIFIEMLTTSSLIIDLTNSGGGDGRAVDQFLDYLGIGGQHGSKNNNPVYILTSKKSISAAEALAYRMKESGRGKVIGERTAGAGYLVDIFDLPHGFYLVNSITSTFSNGDGWQGKGVEPDDYTPASEALRKALQIINGG